MQIRYFITTILLICLAASGYAQAEKAEAEIQDIMKELNVVGLSVAVVKKMKSSIPMHLGRRI